MGFGGQNKYVTFEPNLEKEFSWRLITTSNIARNYSIEPLGDLAEFITINNGNLMYIKPNQNPLIEVSLKLPAAEPSPGEHEIMIYMKELPTLSERSGGLSALSGAIPCIFVNVLYDGKYLESELNINDVNVGEPIKPILDVHNYGKENINNINIKYKIYDISGNELKNGQSKNIVLKSDTGDSIELNIDSNGLNGGIYTIKTDIEWDNQHTFLEKDIRIGTMDVKIINHTQILYINKINEFDIEIESRWNGQINDLYAEITLNNQTVKTANYNLGPWKNQILSGYVNTANMIKGKNNINIKLYYGAVKKETDFNIELVEEEKEFKLNSNLLIISGLIIIVVILVGLNIFVLMKRDKKDGKRKKTNKK